MTDHIEPAPCSSRVAHFFSSTVKPTVDEFFSDPRNIRRGRLASIVLFHMADYWRLAYDAQSASLASLYKALIEECPDFLLIRDVANASKHDILTRTPRTLTSSEQISRAPGLFQAPFGTGVFEEASIIMVTQDDGVARPLDMTVRAVLEMWEAKLEQKSREALTR